MTYITRNLAENTRHDGTKGYDVELQFYGCETLEEAMRYYDLAKNKKQKK